MRVEWRQPQTRALLYIPWACAFLTQINHVTNTVMWAKAWNAGKMYFVGVIKFSCKKPTHFPGIVDLILRKVLLTNIEILSLNKVVLLYEPKSCLDCFALCTWMYHFGVPACISLVWTNRWIKKTERTRAICDRCFN